MPRDIPVGNGSLLVTFDDEYCLRDLFFPHVGMENHTAGHRNRMGVWVDGGFSWVNREWSPRLEYLDESLVSSVSAGNPALGARLYCSDAVDYEESVYLKRVVIENLAGREREFRLFFNHDLHIRGYPDGDTAYYDPDEKALIHYKGDRYFLMSGLRDGRQGVDSYSAGQKEFRGLEGTWRDAEDGSLEGNPIAQGSVDSTLMLSVSVPAGGKSALWYWIAAGESYEDVSRLNRLLSEAGPAYFMDRTENYWRAWVNKEGYDLSPLPAPVAGLYKRSLLTMRTNIDAGGAIIAANDSDIQQFSRDTYGYMWPRDGAFITHALDRAGYHVISRRFFDFCLDIVRRGKEREGYFLHKYNPDGSLGSSWHPWVQGAARRLPIQEDGTGLVLWALWRHFDRYRDIEFAAAHYEHMVKRCADFMVSYRDGKTGLPLPSYDLWEERWGVHTFSVAAVHAGLRAAERFALFFGDRGRAEVYARAAGEIKAALEDKLFSPGHGRFLRGLRYLGDGKPEGDPVVDASVFALFYLGVLEADDPRVKATMKAVEDRLSVNSDIGGIARYEADAYQRGEGYDGLPGNPWIISTLWLAQWKIAGASDLEDLERVTGLLEWTVSRAAPSGILPEQAHPVSGRPLSVAPLTWSHAAFVSAVLDYMERLEKVYVCASCGAPLHRHDPRRPAAAQGGDR